MTHWILTLAAFAAGAALVYMGHPADTIGGCIIIAAAVATSPKHLPRLRFRRRKKYGK